MRFLVKLLMTFLLILGIFSCSKSNSADNKTTSSNKYDHPKDVLRVGGGSEIPSLDPQFSGDSVSARVAFDLFDNLLDFNQANQPVLPAMAESWEASADKKVYTFHLRKDLKFSDGSPITAQDFVFTWQRIVDPKTGTDRGPDLNNVLNARAIMAGKMDKSKLGVSALDSYTFKVILARPDPTILYVASSSDLGVVSQKNVAKFGTAWTKPENMVSYGAYMLHEHITNGKLVIVKNPYYYNKDVVKIPRVEFYPIQDQSAEMAQYRAGNLDMTFTYPINQYQQLKNDLGSEFITIQEAAVYFYEFNFRHKELQDVRLRKALSMAIDRNILTDKVLGQGQKPVYTAIAPTINQGIFADVKYDWSDWPRDKQIAEAKRLYAKAGYSKQHPLSLAISYNTADNHKKIALAIASMWHEVLGINVTQANTEWKVFLQNRTKGAFQIGRMGGVATADDVTNFTDKYRCNDLANPIGYCDPEFDKLMAEAAEISDDNA